MTDNSPKSISKVNDDVVGLTNDVGALEQAEKRIEDAVRSAFLDVGVELRRIRYQRLYREHYSSFQEYCKERWNWSEAHATRLIQAADICEALPQGNGSVLPSAEKHVRPLRRLDEPKLRAAAWTSAVKRAEDDGKPLTAQRVSLEVRRLLKEQGADGAGEASEGERNAARRKRKPPLTVAYISVSAFRGDDTLFLDLKNADIDLLYLCARPAEIFRALHILRGSGLRNADCGIALLDAPRNWTSRRDISLVFRAARDRNILPDARVKHGTGEADVLNQIERIHGRSDRLLYYGTTSRDRWDSRQVSEVVTRKMCSTLLEGYFYDEDGENESANESEIHESDHTEVDLSAIPETYLAAVLFGLKKLSLLNLVSLESSNREQILKNKFDFLKRYCRIMGFVKNVERRTIYESSCVVAAMHQTWQANPEESVKFWSCVACREQGEGSVYLLHKYLVNSDDLLRENDFEDQLVHDYEKAVLAQCVHGWNCWRLGEKWDATFYERGKIPVAYDWIGDGKYHSKKQWLYDLNGVSCVVDGLMFLRENNFANIAEIVDLDLPLEYKDFALFYSDLYPQFSWIFNRVSWRNQCYEKPFVAALYKCWSVDPKSLSVFLSGKGSGGHKQNKQLTGLGIFLGTKRIDDRWAENNRRPRNAVTSKEFYAQCIHAWESWRNGKMMNGTFYKKGIVPDIE